MSLMDMSLKPWHSWFSHILRRRLGSPAWRWRPTGHVRNSLQIFGPIEGFAGNTTSEGYELLALVAEHNLKAYIVAMMFLRPRASQPVMDSAARQRRQGARTALIKSWLSALKARGLAPWLVHLDKDFSEISAVREVWTDAYMQICLWHALKAVETRLAGPPSKKRVVYYPDDAKDVIPELDPSWVPGGHDPKQRRRSGFSFEAHVSASASSVNEPQAASLPDPSSREAFGRLSAQLGVASAVDAIEEESDAAEYPTTLCATQKRAREAERFCPVQYRSFIVSLFRSHFNWQPDIPVAGSGFLTSSQIYRKAARQMYLACHCRDLRALWAYMWEHWYRPARWMLWARSNYVDMPVWRTTTYLEAIWRVIKAFAHTSNRRLPLDHFVLALVDYLDRITEDRRDLEHGAATHNYRYLEPRWSNEFKRAWYGKHTLRGGRRRKTKKTRPSIGLITLPAQSRPRQSWTQMMGIYLIIASQIPTHSMRIMSIPIKLTLIWTLTTERRAI